MRVALVASPLANLGSITRALRASGAVLDVTADRRAIARASKIVLPGVGTFGASMEWLDTTGIAAALRRAVARGAMLLGICVGHQLLFDDSGELLSCHAQTGSGRDTTPGAIRGLGFVRGSVRRFPPGLPVPQVGWNRVRTTSDPLFAGIAPASPFFFVNSYCATTVASAATIGRAQYGVDFVAAVRQGNVIGVQFHPEKSSAAGLQLLSNFVRLQ